MVISVQLMLERKTKGALRYREVDDAGQFLAIGVASIGVIYVRKSVLNDAEPKLITAVIHMTDETINELPNGGGSFPCSRAATGKR